MRHLELEEMENIVGDGMGSAFCKGVGTAGAIYGVGAGLTAIGVANFWNPVGWVTLAQVQEKSKNLPFSSRCKGCHTKIAWVLYCFFERIT